MLIGTSTRKIDIPHEEGQWIEVRDLTRKEITESKRLKMVETMTSMKDFGDIMQMFTGMTTIKDVPITVESYDLDYVLEKAITGWSYDEEAGPESISRLDQKTSELVACDLLGIEDEGDRVKD